MAVAKGQKITKVQDRQDEQRDRLRRVGELYEGERTRRGLSIRQVSIDTGLSWVTIRNLEDAKDTYLTTALTLADYYGMPIFGLFG